jgi:hypothetical protein
MKNLLNIWSFLKGRKTYIMVLTTLVYAAVGYWTGTLDAEATRALILQALTAAGLRHAL